MVKRAFTLIEMIITIAIMSFMIMGGFMIVNKIYKRNYIVKTMSKFEFQTQQVLDQVSSMIYNRVPLSVIGYSPASGDYKYIGFVEEGEDYPVVEWIGYLSEAMNDTNLSGFVDLYGSDANNKILKCVDFNYNYAENVAKNIYDVSSLSSAGAIIFAGSFDRGEDNALNDYKNSFGWHGGGAKYVYTFDLNKTEGNNAYLQLKNFTGGRIYEKYYLAISAFAIARVGDLKKDNLSNCPVDLSGEDDNTLLLFYNYRPWLGETFCADDNGKGDVTVLARNVSAFRVKGVNSHLEIKMNMEENRSLFVRVSKQKVAF
ncbi:MAG: type II secretion system protein [Epsilonproteobacteria bacterium]|nr:type II secretion system protein [Campylobacterota bacterium]